MMDPEMEMITLDSMGHAEAVKRTAATATAATAMTSTSTTVESSTSFIASSTAPLSPARLSTSLSSTSPSIPHPIPAATLSSPSYRRSATAALSYNIKNRSNTIDKIRLLDLGYSEQLGRSLDFWSSCSIGICNIGMLPGVFFGATTALTTGGSSMYSIAFPLTGICLCAVVAVLGEMSSTFPVAGAMLTYTFRICRTSKRFDSSARYLSWLVGSFLLASHLLVQIVLTYQLARVIQSVISITCNYESSFWNTILISWALLALFAFVVCSPFSASPWLWKAGGLFTIASVVIINIVLLTQSNEIRSARVLFTTYANGTGFDSVALVYLLGWVMTCVATGAEACAHVAEDTIRPTRTVPMAMFWSVAVSYALGWITICIFLSTAHLNMDEIDVGSPSGLITKTVSESYAVLVLVLIVICSAFQNVAQLLATSRFIWALSREAALPFSDFFKVISRRNRLPIHATGAVVLIAGPALLLLRINQNIIGLVLLDGSGYCAILAYLIPILIYVLSPADALRGDGRSEWTLRSWSQPIARLSVAFCSLVLIVVCFPTDYPVDALSLPWSIVVGSGLFLITSIAWIFYGNARYAGPIKSTTRWTLGTEASLPRSSALNSSKLAPRHLSSSFAASQPYRQHQYRDPRVDSGGTTSNDLGRSAHVFESFPTLDRSGISSTGGSGGTNGVGRRRSTRMSQTMTRRGSGENGVASMSTSGGESDFGLEDWDEENDDEDYEEEEEEQGTGGNERAAVNDGSGEGNGWKPAEASRV